MGTGPSELTIFTPDVIPAMFEGINNTFTRPAWFDGSRPYSGLATERDTGIHNHRRRVWDQAFTSKGLCHGETDHVRRNFQLTIPFSCAQLRSPSQSIRRPT